MHLCARSHLTKEAFWLMHLRLAFVWAEGNIDYQVASVSFGKMTFVKESRSSKLYTSGVVTAGVIPDKKKIEWSNCESVSG